MGFLKPRADGKVFICFCCKGATHCNQWLIWLKYRKSPQFVECSSKGVSPKIYKVNLTTFQNFRYQGDIITINSVLLKLYPHAVVIIIIIMIIIKIIIDFI